MCVFVGLDELAGGPAATTFAATVMAGAKVVDLTGDGDGGCALEYDSETYGLMVEELLRALNGALAAPGCAYTWPAFEVCEAMHGRPQQRDAIVAALLRDRVSARAEREPCGICHDVPADTDVERPKRPTPQLSS